MIARLDVLERDLIDPPKIEIIDENYQKFLGVLYRRRKPRHNRQMCHYQQSIQLHQVVWNYYFGEIPVGLVIHHRDLNPANNDISNLQLLTNAQHQHLHRSIEGELRRNKQLVCKNCGKTFLSSPCRPRRFCSNSCASKWRMSRH